MKWITRLLISLCFMVITLVVSAQESYPALEFVSGGINDPRVNESANACYYGGTLAGKCNTTDVNADKVIDNYDRDWMWQAGWHLIRFEYNFFNRENFDEAYIPLLQPDPIHRINGASGCYGVVYEDLVGVYLLWNGGYSTRDVLLYDNDECINIPVRIIEKVIAIETYEEADAICKKQHGGEWYALRFTRSFYRCIIPKYPVNPSVPIGAVAPVGVR
jgi:hypothetical protein